MRREKIAIVGAGICGLYLGNKLTREGHQVIIYDKDKEIGKPSCSALFSERILDFIPEAGDFVQNKILSAKIYFPEKTVDIEFKNRFLAVNRVKLEKELAALTQSSGARIFLDHYVHSIPSRFDYVIGCDGARSTIRRKLGLKEPSFRLGIRGFIKEENRESCVETWPVPNGFIWKIPRGDRTEYGIIAPPEDAREKLEEFAERKDLNLEEISSDLIASGFKTSKNPSVCLCGESLGLTKPWSGGGVIWGLIASEILLANFPDLSSYRWELKKFFLPRILLTTVATKIAYLAGFKFPRILPKNVKLENDFLK